MQDTLDDATYEIAPELKVRQLVEEQTNWRYTVEKAEKYEYDLRVCRWDEDAAGPGGRTELGYIEVEQADRWQSGSVPDNWVYYSFVERKICDYDHQRDEWRGRKDNASRTMYFKVNQSVDGCFTAPVSVIHRDGSWTKRSTGEYENTYRSLEFGHDAVTRGISDAIDAAVRYLEWVADADQLEGGDG